MFKRVGPSRHLLSTASVWILSALCLVGGTVRAVSAPPVDAGDDYIDPGLAAIEARAERNRQAQRQGRDYSGKLLFTAGISSLQGPAGGGLNPWAVIGGYGSTGQIGANGFYTRVPLRDFDLESYGALVGIDDRIEISLARTSFDTKKVGAALGLGSHYFISTNSYGLKVRLSGDAVLDQDSLLPQVAAGIIYRTVDRANLVRALGARDDQDAEFYLSATKLLLEQSLLVSAAVTFTRANQFGILGFGGTRADNYQACPQISLAYLLGRHWIIGAEYRARPDNLASFREGNGFDGFIAFAPTKNFTANLALVDLGPIVGKSNQRGLYGAIQFGF